MNFGRSRPVPVILGAGAAIATLFLGACVSPPDLDTPADPPVVTEAAALPPEGSAERRAAVEDMRAKAEAGDEMASPDAFQSARISRLAARPEPKPLADVAAIEAELAEIARQQEGRVSASELAAMKARAEELRRLAAAARAGTSR